MRGEPRFFDVGDHLKAFAAHGFRYVLLRARGCAELLRRRTGRGGRCSIPVMRKSLSAWDNLSASAPSSLTTTAFRSCGF